MLFRSVQGEYWFVCNKHTAKWYVGSKIFGSERAQYCGEIVSEMARLKKFREVKPYYGPEDRKR